MRKQARASRRYPVSVGDAGKDLVCSVMSRKVVTARPTTTLASAMQAMVLQDIGHVPVVDETGILVGILSKTDIVQKHAVDGNNVEVDRGPQVPAKKGVTYDLGNGFHFGDEEATTVGDVMSRRVLSVMESTTLAEAAQLMVKRRIHGLPVVSESRRVVGFISTMDLAQWVAGKPPKGATADAARL